MKNLNVLQRLRKTTGLTFDELYQEISKGWELKACQLQERRWKMLKHKGD